MLKDLRNTCETYYDEHVPESSVENLGHSTGGITYRHYAQRAPLAFLAIMTLPQPTAFTALAKGFDGQCARCRSEFVESSGYRLCYPECIRSGTGSIETLSRIAGS